jgi:hypothetical protein
MDQEPIQIAINSTGKRRQASSQRYPCSLIHSYSTHIAKKAANYWRARSSEWYGQRNWRGVSDRDKEISPARSRGKAGIWGEKTERSRRARGKSSGSPAPSCLSSSAGKGKEVRTAVGAASQLTGMKMTVFWSPFSLWAHVWLSSWKIVRLNFFFSKKLK